MEYCTGDKNETNRKGCQEKILEKASNFIKEFQDYRTAYGNYINNKTSNESNKLIDDYNKLSKMLQELKTLIDAYTSKYLLPNGANQEPNQFYDEIMIKYGHMLEGRKQLDQQIYDLYTTDYDSVYSNKPTLDSSIVTGVLWTIIVTFMLYYVIVKL